MLSRAQMYGLKDILESPKLDLRNNYIVSMSLRNGYAMIMNAVSKFVSRHVEFVKNTRSRLDREFFWKFWKVQMR